jgi:hypothetical protein
MRVFDNISCAQRCPVDVSHASAPINGVAMSVVCGKKPYPNLTQAQLAMRAIVRRTAGQSRKVPTGVYPCRTCGSWHLTSKAKRGVAMWWQR